jgi:hypothetical protein
VRWTDRYRILTHASQIKIDIETKFAFKGYLTTEQAVVTARDPVLMSAGTPVIRQMFLPMLVTTSRQIPG